MWQSSVVSFLQELTTVMWDLENKLKHCKIFMSFFQ